VIKKWTVSKSDSIVKSTDLTKKERQDLINILENVLKQWDKDFNMPSELYCAVFVTKFLG
jgi:galactose-1-phosphate uridylyltransferase